MSVRASQTIGAHGVGGDRIRTPFSINAWKFAPCRDDLRGEAARRAIGDVMSIEDIVTVDQGSQENAYWHYEKEPFTSYLRC
ncbi:hypothetical protein ETB97_003227 [Aspergillus alliaceus]|uniref:Uncharacterized protein n=1 Tax=Petromyces alliaceus TaxID=209559 RepID=A0A8H6A0D7_PETAA|nr:hypothetical protein ETB97_003227 [Aspergillus burnettii]